MDTVLVCNIKYVNYLIRRTKTNLLQDLSVVIPNVVLKISAVLKITAPTAALRWTRIEVILLNDSQHFVTLIGYLTIIFIIIGVLILLVELVKFGLENLKRIYKYKHRFDKKPTAKCYCIDCKYHDNFTGSCFGFDRHHHTADNWFCWKASPRK